MIIPWSFSPLVLRPALWLDASDASTLYSGASLAAADGAISEWRDKSGWNRHASQATGVSQPLRKTAIQNGRDVVRFDGANDWLDHPLSADVCTVFLAYNLLAVQAGYRGLIAANGFMMLSLVGGKWGSYGTADMTANTSASTGVVLQVMQTTGAGNVTNFFRNGTSDGTVSDNPDGQLNHIGGFLPGSQSTNMDCFEIMVFPAALSDADRQAVENYLNAKWAIY